MNATVHATSRIYNRGPVSRSLLGHVKPLFQSNSKAMHAKSAMLCQLQPFASIHLCFSTLEEVNVCELLHLVDVGSFDNLFIIEQHP